MKRDLKIISGGQTGADLAGLWSARIFGLPTGGFAPKGWQTQSGAMPQLGEFFNLKESESDYHGRTLRNCEASHLTIIFASNIKSPGTRLTLHNCITNRIRCRVFPFSNSGDIARYVATHAETITDLIQSFSDSQQLVLNIAGNSTQTSSDTFTITFLTMCKVFENVCTKVDLSQDIFKVEEMLRDCYNVDKYKMIHKLATSE